MDFDLKSRRGVGGSVALIGAEIRTWSPSCSWCCSWDVVTAATHGAQAIKLITLKNFAAYVTR